MKYSILSLVGLCFLSAIAVARPHVYVPIPPMEPITLIPSPEGLYRDTPPVLMGNSAELMAHERKASQLWHYYQYSVYGKHAPVVISMRDNTEQVLVNDYILNRERLREKHRMHEYYSNLINHAYIEVPQQPYNYSSGWFNYDW